MIDWDSLLPAPPALPELLPPSALGHADAEEKPRNGAAGEDWLGQGEAAEVYDLGNKNGAVVPVCPSQKPGLSQSAGQPKPSIHAGFLGGVPVVPVVPPLKQGAACLAGENHPPGEGRRKVFCAENEGGGEHLQQQYPASPSALLLALAWCRQMRVSREEAAALLLDLGSQPPADQVRHWHGVCVAAGLAPWQVLNLPSQGEGTDCSCCAHLGSVAERIEGERRQFRWACKLGYLILEYGRHTERILLAPPECRSWERWYPSDQR